MNFRLQRVAKQTPYGHTVRHPPVRPVGGRVGGQSTVATVQMFRPSTADLLLRFGSMPGKAVARLVYPTSVRQPTDLGVVVD
jgi:hypothetical protein